MRYFFLFSSLIASTISLAQADSVIVKLKHISSNGIQNAGFAVLQDTPHGLLISPNLKGLLTGIRAMHVHEHPDCSSKNGVPGGAAGSHYDPMGTDMHLGPYQEGHLGDLPPLYADKEGVASTPVLAPRVKVKDVRGRALMVHEGGDTFSDIPHQLGGGGGRMACGVIPLK